MRNPHPKRKDNESLSVLGLHHLIQLDYCAEMTSAALQAVVDRLDDVDPVPGSITVVVALEGVVENEDALARYKDALKRGDISFPEDAIEVRLYVSLHPTRRTKPRADWRLVLQHDNGAQFYLAPIGESGSRVFSGNLLVPEEGETDRWLVCEAKRFCALAQEDSRKRFERTIPLLSLLRATLIMDEA